METKEREWFLHKVGKFSASNADKLMSASGKWIEGNIDYLYELQYQRLTGEPTPPVYARPMQLGIENEPYGIEWIRSNKPELNILHCESDFTEKVFEEPYEGLMFGVSPDAFVMDAKPSAEWNGICGEYVKSHISALLEVKCVVGRKNTVRYFSPTLDFDTKRDMAKKEHIWQMAAQLFAYPNVETIFLLKYLPQIDDNPWDLRSVTDPTRGLLFEFSRDELIVEIRTIEMRIRYADAYIKSGKDLEMINVLKIEI
jgi:hypothetical protein